MRYYSFISAAVLALSSSVFAQTAGYNAFITPLENEVVPAGKPYEVKWLVGSFHEGTGSIQLLEGPSRDKLQLGPVIDGAVSNSAGKYTWNIPADITKADLYGLKFTNNANSSVFQYSFPFKISAASDPSTRTVIIHLSPGAAYIPDPTTTPTISKTSTISTTSAIVTSVYNSTSVIPTAKPSSNFTLPSSSTTRAVAIATPATTFPAHVSGNTAVANAVRGSFALIGGAVLAFAL